ncbi:MAG TPA: TonB family protein [Gemmatimonadaceae bacterium]|nr:TonB family protein [Gemmatimonadaceae bacterium]
MFGTLIESRAARQRRTGSSIASLVIHTALIAGGVMVSARHSIDAAAAPDDAKTEVVFDVFSPKPVDPPLASRPITAPAIAVAPRALVLNTPAVVPVEIPPIDLSVAPTPPDFSDRRIASSLIQRLCDRDCARSGAPPSDTAGRDTWTASDVMMRLRADPVPPRYPESLRRAGIEGSVVVRFVVDTSGRVDMASIEVVRSTHDAFTAAVRESVARLRFTASMAGDRKVRAQAMMPFQFTLR